MCAPDPPDTSKETMAGIELQERIAEKNFARADEQFEYFKKRQDEVDRVAAEATQRQLAMGEETAAQGRDLYNYQKEVFRPVEQSLVSQAMRESTPEYFERYAQEAVTKQAMANANAQGQTERAMASMGVNPNSGAYQSAQRGLTLANAAGLGAVSNSARDQADSMAWARRADVAGIGKGLVGAGNASYGLASGANSSASAITNAATTTAAGSQGTSSTYGSLGLNASQGATKARTDIYNTQVSNMGDGGAGLAGSVLGMAAMAMM